VFILVLVFFHLFKEGFDVSIVIGRKLYDPLEGAAKVSFDLFVLFSSINDEVVDPILQIDMHSMHVLVKFTETALQVFDDRVTGEHMVPVLFSRLRKLQQHVLHPQLHVLQLLLPLHLFLTRLL
jgi:hypothetical protein